MSWRDLWENNNNNNNKFKGQKQVEEVGDKLGETINDENPIVPYLGKAVSAAVMYAGSKSAEATARLIDEAFGEGGNYE